MSLLTKCYHHIIRWSRHRHAPWYLYALSFAESSFFPIPPDFMLAPMTLAKPENGYKYAAYTTISSVIGGLFGYIIGFFFMHLLMPYITHFGYAGKFAEVAHWFAEWGFWVMFFAGFAIIPYKFFTITAGAMHIPLLPFILGSLVGRGGRFFLVVWLIRWRGAAMEKMLLRYIDRAGFWGAIGLIAALAIYHYI